MLQRLQNLARLRREHPRAWTWGIAMTMAGLSLVIGLGVTIYDGVMNPDRESAAFFVALGFCAFYLPGLAIAGAAFGMRRGWVRIVRLGVAAAIVQGVMALGFALGHPLVIFFSALFLLPGVLWAAMDFYVAWRLWLALPWVNSDPASRRGFDLETVEAEAAS